MLRDLLKTYLGRYWSLLSWVLVFQTVQTLAALFLPTLNADIINRGVALGDTGYIWRVGAVMLGITCVQVVFAIAAVYFGSRASMGFGRDVRAGLFHQVNDFSAQEMTHFGAPSLITRITNDVAQVQMLVLTTCTMLVAAPITAIGGFILALNQDVGLSWILVVAIPLLVVILGIVLVRMVPQFRLMQERIDRINQMLREQLTGVRVVRAFVREPQESERFAHGNELLTDTALRSGRLMALMFPIVNVVVNISSVAVLWIGSNRIADGSISVGSMIAFLTYLIQILMAVMMATFMAALLPRATVSAERIQEVLNTPISILVAKNPITQVLDIASLELKHVGFSYPGAAQPVLHDVSVTCRAGEVLAIIGSTGSGKTTLMNLIPRLTDATTGVVYVDGVDVRKLAPHILWSRVGVIPQKPYLFSGSVASNLRYGKPDATEEEMWEALHIAQAADFVEQMPGGLNAPISQGGANVSGGQRQRLAIARALVHRPEIYLFDDSFSALDLATDARLRSAMIPYVSESIVVVVAQRVSTIRNAQQIMVLEDGLVMGLGSHDELMATCQTYQEIVASQLSIDEGAA
ncbi:multidrug ABC transporter ATP-binding protein [Actinomycetes bacterium]|nr:multidrug ABC transporter ATP-binding protein [Actinomycetes bacterium]